jgi:uncharacterized membrane protein YqhA
MRILEILFEGALWRSRFVVLLAVVFAIFGAVALFAVASADIWHMVVLTWDVFVNHIHPENFHEKLIGGIIGAIDLYLIAVVLLIFAFGIYELFISQIDEADDSEVGASILAVHNLDELKSKLGNVIVMVLIVIFFKKVIHMKFETPLDMLYLAGGIFALALSLYYMHKAHEGQH